MLGEADAVMQLELFGKGEGETGKKLNGSSTFVDNMQLPVHRWFRYSAGFSAEWVKSLIYQRRRSSLRILDPFAGSGTTLVASDECDVSSIGVDAHPFVTRIARAKLNWGSDPDKFVKHLNQLISHAQDYYHASKYEFQLAPSLIQKSYSEDSAKKLDAFKTAWMQLDDGSPSTELVWLAITAILRACSAVGTAPWQYILPNKAKVQVLEPFDALRLQCQMMQEDMMRLQGKTEKSRATMLCADARTLEGIGTSSVNFVITSPPYANNYDYADATRLEMTFWGMVSSWGDLQATVRQHLIRACSQHVSAERLILEELLDDSNIKPIIDELAPVCQELADERHLHGGKKQYHLMVAAYFSDMARVWKALQRVCSEDAEVCFVVGDSAPYGIHVPVDKWLAILADEAGFEFVRFVQTRDRNVKWANRTHTVLLREGELWFRAIRQHQQRVRFSMADVTSPGHKLGQMIGNFFEDFFGKPLSEFAERNDLYLDQKGLRPRVREKRKKVTWRDSRGTPHDLDYVFERGGSEDTLGTPVAFIELAWRRYTKHSRNKASEIEGALFHLGNTYPGAYVGALLAGEWTQGSLEQLGARGIKYLHIPFEDMVEAFKLGGVNLQYEEDDPDNVKLGIIETWEALTDEQMETIKIDLATRIENQYQEFLSSLGERFSKTVTAIRVYFLYKDEALYYSVEEAIDAIERYKLEEGRELEFERIEVELRFSTGSNIRGEFPTKEEAVEFIVRNTM